MSQNLINKINDSKMTASWKTDAYLKAFNMIHYGSDIVSSAFSTTLYASGNGEIVGYGFDSILGNFIVIKYTAAYNRISKLSKDVICRIWHLAKIESTIKKGLKITKDTKLGNYGNTGQYSTGAHLHIEFDTDTSHPYYTPTLKGMTANFYGRDYGANDKTMTNPTEWLFYKPTAPDKQTWTTANDQYIRPEDKNLPVWPESNTSKIDVEPTPVVSETKIEGIDISEHNQIVDFKKVKAAGKKFVMVRLGWAGWDGGIRSNGGIDRNFDTNIRNAIAVGIDVGIYVYSYCKTPAAAIVAARETLELMKPYNLTYPIAFDIEDTSPTGTPYNKMSKELNTSIAAAFLNVISASGNIGILYTYKTFADAYLNTSDLSEWDTWIAMYANTCTYTGKYTMWQYKGDVAGFIGSCDGVIGACDLNVSYKDYGAIIKTIPTPDPVDPPTEDCKHEEVIITLQEEVTALQLEILRLQKEIDNKDAVIDQIIDVLKKYA